MAPHRRNKSRADGEMRSVSTHFSPRKPTMPILTAEPDLYPYNLFECPDLGADRERRWWAIYTLSRREKELMRQLRALDVPHYGPIVPRRQRAPNGRVRVSHLPLFSNYVFLYGSAEQRYRALTTNCVSRCLDVADGVRLTYDLKQVRHLILTGAPVTIEAKLEPGTRVRVKAGMLRGQEGMIIRRQGETRLLVAVNFLQQGASVLLDDIAVEQLD
jgi:transcription antitermination factor NusG